MVQVDYFLKIEGVDGESTDDKHKGEIVLHSWSFGASNAGSVSNAGGGGAGKVALRDFHFTKAVDKASVKLFVACCSGEHLKSAALFGRKSGGRQVEFLKIVLTNIVVSAFETDSVAESGIPEDQVSLGFGQIACTYVEQRPDGSLIETVGGWDAITNRKV